MKCSNNNGIMEELDVHGRQREGEREELLNHSCKTLVAIYFVFSRSGLLFKILVFFEPISLFEQGREEEEDRVKNNLQLQL